PGAPMDNGLRRRSLALVDNTRRQTISNHARAAQSHAQIRYRLSRLRREARAMTESDAYKLLPAGAVWSCCFGNPGEGGFTEYFRAGGRRWVITNGPWDGVPWAFDWR